MPADNPDRTALRAALTRLYNEHKRRGEGLEVPGLGRQLGVSVQTVYNWFNCTVKPQPDRFDELVLLLGADADAQRQLTELYERAYGPHGPVVVVGEIPSEAAYFQSRAAVTKLVSSTMRPTGAQAVICGFGGVGKTQTAAAYARKLIKAQGTDVLVWASASARGAIASAYGNAAKVLRLESAEGADAAALAFKSWLGQPDRRWTIVLDDVGEADLVREWWPTMSPSGRLLVTSRRRDADLLAGRTLIDLDVYTPREARSYLDRRLPSNLVVDDVDGVDGVVDDLGRHPLALDHACAYMIDRDLRCSAYRIAFSDRRRQLAKLFPEKQEIFNPSLTVAATLTLSIEPADRLPPRGVAAPILHLAAFLDPAGVPVRVFTTSAASGYVARHRDSPELSADDVREGLGNLRRLSLVYLDSESVRTHALVQRAVRDTLSDDTADKAATAAADALLEVWPDSERDPALAATLRASSGDLFLNRGTVLTADAIHPVLFHAAESLASSGSHRAATGFLEGLLERVQEQLGPRHRDVLSVRNSLAMVHGQAGDPQGAVALFEQLTPDVCAVLGEGHPHALATRHNLMYWLGQAGRADDAARAGEQLLADQVTVHGADHPATLVTRVLVARWYGLAGDLPRAIAATEELIPDLVRVLGADHPQTFTARNDLAYWYGKAGRADASVIAFEQLLADRIRVLGPEHHHTLISRNNLATQRGQTGDAPGAVSDFRGLLDDIRRILGPDHPDAIATQGNLAFWLAEAGDLDTAIAIGEELLAHMPPGLAKDHPKVLATRHNLATWRGQSGDSAAAVNGLAAMLVDRERVLGPDHPDTLHTRSNLAQWRLSAGNATRAAGVQDDQRTGE
jgi:hypothetical protein